MAARTVRELLELLQRYHQQRRETYRGLAEQGTDERASLLLNHLVQLEDQALRILGEEHKRLQPEHASYLPSGPTLSIEPTHAMDCRCESGPSFDDALHCALTSDEALDEVIDHIAGASPAGSVQSLAQRLREVERTKDQQIARFTRGD